jgi:hypothetical protein
MRALLAALLTALLASYAVAECPNACSSHGKCGAFDMCQCYRNWMSSDCSERKLLFSLVFVFRWGYILCRDESNGFDE